MSSKLKGLPAVILRFLEPIHSLLLWARWENRLEKALEKDVERATQARNSSLCPEEVQRGLCEHCRAY